jgi:hypothetical protein
VNGNRLEFFLDGCVDKPIEFVCTKIVNAGYTGKNQAEVRKHIDELKALGVPAPDSVPTYYAKACGLLTYADSLEVADTDNSGEAEYVILVGKDEMFIAAGSDHTDRNLEVTSVISKAKQMCPNVISRSVWRLSDLEDHWDDLVIKAWINGDPNEVYQEAKLSAMLNPQEILERVRPLVDGDLTGTIIYSGTVATIGEIRFSNKFEMTLEDSVRGKTLYCGYSIQPFPWFKNPA